MLNRSICSAHTRPRGRGGGGGSVQSSGRNNGWPEYGGGLHVHDLRKKPTLYLPGVAVLFLDVLTSAAIARYLFVRFHIIHNSENERTCDRKKALKVKAEKILPFVSGIRQVLFVLLTPLACSIPCCLPRSKAPSAASLRSSLSCPS